MPRVRASPTVSRTDGSSVSPDAIVAVVVEGDDGQLHSVLQGPRNLGPVCEWLRTREEGQPLARLPL